MRKLIELPDAKTHPPLTLGKEYRILGEMGVNGLVIEADDGRLVCVLYTRFS